MSDRKGLWTGEHPDGHRTWAAPRRRRAHPASEPPPPLSPPIAGACAASP